MRRGRRGHHQVELPKGVAVELVNATPVPAKLLVSEVEGYPARFGMISAKATYNFDTSGPFDFETEKPYPLLPVDVPTPLGLLPRDDLPRADDVFEVIVLGRAHSPSKKPVAEVKVGVRVGNVERRLVVFGDRDWTAQRAIGPAKPFEAMPLTWDRAFGGSADILVDKDSPVTVSDPINRLGKGFDHLGQVDDLKAMFTPPAPYPQADPRRPLPNLEDPESLIAKWEDAPRPVCWATMPLDLGMHALRSMDAKVGEDGMTEGGVKPALFHRAHPDWVIARPAAGSIVLVEGMTPEGTAAFRLPKLRILADWVVGKQAGTSELIPQVLVILPEKKRFTLLYKLVNTVFPREGEERSIRLRLEEGWMAPEQVA